MKAIFKLKRLYILLLFPAALLITLAARISCVWVENFYFPFVYTPIASVIGFISSLVPFSLTEVLAVAVTAFFIYSVIRSIRRKYSPIKFLINCLCTISALIFAFTLTMGLNYYRATAAEKMGIQVEKYSKDDLYELCDMLVADLNDSRAEMDENAAGVAVLSDKNRFETSLEAQNAYRNLSIRYPFLGAVNIRNKPLLSSRLFSYFLTSGIYIPFTFESNINVDVPEFTIPATMCHELTHYRGFMRENEANFLGYLACMGSKRADFRYSASMLAFEYAYPKLYDEDQALAKQLGAKLSQQVLTDIVANDAYWQQFYNTKTADISNIVYDGYLNANGQTSGLKSYGEMVDLLIAYTKTR